MDFITVDRLELSKKFDHYMQVVQEGQLVKICKRGKPIAIIIPASIAEEDRLITLAAVGVLLWKKRIPKPQALKANDKVSTKTSTKRLTGKRK